MYLGSRKEKNNYFRIRNGKSVPYSIHKTILEYKCDTCGNNYEKDKNGKDHGLDRMHFCSSCYNPSFVTKTLAGKRQSKRKIGSIGEKRIIGKTKYIEVWVGYDSWHQKNPKNNGWIREHIYVMQESLGYTIPEGYVVHHIDGNKKNNKIENLSLLTIAEHNNAHAKSELLIFELVEKGLVIFDRETKLYEFSNK